MNQDSWVNRSWPWKGLSVVKRKFHATFLWDGITAMWSCYLAALFPNFRKYCDQKIAKKKSQSTTPACVLSSSNPCMWKIDPIHRVRLNFFVRFTPIRKPKTTTSRTAIASHFFLAFIKSSESLSQLVVLECQRPPWPTPKVPVSDWCVPESC